MTDVSVLGTGRMGAAIARRFLAAGKSVTVWNRTPDKAAALAAFGAKVASSAADAVAASSLCVVVIIDYDAVWQHLGKSGAELTGIDVVNLTSGSPEQAAVLADRFARARGHLLEGCILTYPSEIGTADAALTYSGSVEVWDRHRDTLVLLGGRTEYLGSDVSLANVIDVMALAFYTAAATASLEAAAYAKTQGLDFAAIEPILHANVGVLDQFITHASAKIAANDYHVEDAALDTYLAALEGVVTTMRTALFPSRLAAATRDAMRTGVDAGHGGEDLFVLYDVMSRGHTSGPG